jgi:hypothetical protein
MNQELSKPHFHRQLIEGYDLLDYKDNKYDLHSSIIETKSGALESWILILSTEDMHCYTEKDVVNTMNWSSLTSLTKVMKIDCFCSTCVNLQ